MDRIELCYEYLFIYNATIAAKPSSNDRVPHWRSDQFRENMFDTAEAMLTAPMSAPTVAAYASARTRSEEHTSELQSLMRISYAVFCLKKKNKRQIYTKLI